MEGVPYGQILNTFGEKIGRIEKIERIRGVGGLFLFFRLFFRRRR
jgi:hypothetical protein